MYIYIYIYIYVLDVYITNEKTFLKITSVIFRLFTNFLGANGLN